MAGILADVLAGALTPGCEVVAAGLADVMADVLADGLTEFLADVLPHTLRKKQKRMEKGRYYVLGPQSSIVII